MRIRGYGFWDGQRFRHRLGLLDWGLVALIWLGALGTVVLAFGCALFGWSL